MGLTRDQFQLLDEIEHDEELKPVFLRTIVGLKWFTELKKRGFFLPEDNPKPETSENNRVVVSYWDILDYLDKTSNELKIDNVTEYTKEEIREFSSEYLNIFRTVTYASKSDGFSNYRTWSRFSEILNKIPVDIVSEDDILMIEYWLDDPYDNYIVCENIGRKWLPHLLDMNSEHSLLLAERILPCIFLVNEGNNKSDNEELDYERIDDLSFRIDMYQCQEIVNETARRIGNKIGARFIPWIMQQITSVIGESNKQNSLVIYRPSIEDDDQNRIRENVLDVLINLLRDILEGFVNSDSDEVIPLLRSLLLCETTIISRVAIHTISNNFTLCGDLYAELIAPTQRFWNERYKHELWTLLKQNYIYLDRTIKEITLERITGLYNEDVEMSDDVKAYYQSEWYASIRDFGIKENQLYNESVEKAGTEPVHPSFAVYGEAGIVDPKSPKSVEEICSMETNELVDYLEAFKPDTSNFFENQLSGLFNVIQEAIKLQPLRFSSKLPYLTSLDISYIYHMLVGFKNAWIDKPREPWLGVWSLLLTFCESILSRAEFSNDNHQSKFGGGPMIPRQEWVIGAIASLIEEGVRNDEHSFDAQYSDSAKRIIEMMLGRQTNESYNTNMNAVTNAINSAQGKCIQALLNLTLRSCRLADRSSAGGNGKDHNATWLLFRKLFDRELSRENSSYEIHTLLARYLPNLLYVSREWTLENLDAIFVKDDYHHWHCAMSGFAYASATNREVYDFLINEGHLLRALDVKEVDSEIKTKAIALGCSTYLQDMENLQSDESFLKTILDRKKKVEYIEIIRQFWIRGRKDKSNSIKIINVIKAILDRVSLTDPHGPLVASKLCLLIECLDNIDEIVLGYLVSIVPYAEVDHNGDHVLKCLAEMNDVRPEYLYRIWKSLIKIDFPTYPEGSIKTLFENILKDSGSGTAWTRDIADKYTKAKIFRPHQILVELLNRT